MLPSKRKSDKLFADNGLPCPQYYPAGKFPYFAKPESESGSHGVRRFENKTELEDFLEKGGDKYIVQEFVEGPSYYDGVGQTVALWSGTPTEWTRVKVEFTVQNGSVTTAVYEKVAGANDADYELVSAYQSISIEQSYIVDELINLSFYSEFDGTAACYFDNVDVYTLVEVEPEWQLYRICFLQLRFQ